MALDILEGEALFLFLGRKGALMASPPGSLGSPKRAEGQAFLGWNTAKHAALMAPLPSTHSLVLIYFEYTLLGFVGLGPSTAQHSALKAFLPALGNL